VNINENTNSMYHAYFYDVNSITNKSEKHGFYFVCNSKENALKNFCEYAEVALGRNLEKSEVFIEEMMEGAKIETSPGKVTISCS
jgi:hypothetical protein